MFFGGTQCMNDNRITTYAPCICDANPRLTMTFTHWLWLTILGKWATQPPVTHDESLWLSVHDLDLRSRSQPLTASQTVARRDRRLHGPLCLELSAIRVKVIVDWIVLWLTLLTASWPTYVYRISAGLNQYVLLHSGFALHNAQWNVGLNDDGKDMRCDYLIKGCLTYTPLVTSSVLSSYSYRILYTCCLLSYQFCPIV